ncbi:hypothetical protein [Streptomyces acidicola]|uniref:Uncharacterized protein n=1 Tax=Streptomyces acidicola TaxID=2596892 RepID=A0A5N8WMI5_9ACTN|nr:hypothetical protein [Streptomyces acidicola]MPY48046.1 hypothetical protein [Streptomyces acidicola]
MELKGARRRGGREHDVDAVLDELYTTPPAHFVPRREELAAAARTAGRAEDSRRIRSARRPTLAAWAANLLLRSKPQESRQFLELGSALREAHRTMDPGAIKDLSGQRRRVVAALSRQAAQLALDAGHRLSDSVRHEVESTLNAVLADPDAADLWATGRLHSALTPPAAFPSGTAPAAGTRRKAASPTAPPSPRAQRTDELAERRRAREEKLAQAHRAAEEAVRRLRDQRTEYAAAEASLEQARDRQDRAQQRVVDAEQQVQQAREALKPAGREQRQAEKQLRASADALARAEREARETAREVQRLGRGQRS